MSDHRSEQKVEALARRAGYQELKDTPAEIIEKLNALAQASQAFPLFTYLEGMEILNRYPEGFSRAAFAEEGRNSSIWTMFALDKMLMLRERERRDSNVTQPSSDFLLFLDALLSIMDRG